MSFIKGHIKDLVNFNYDWVLNELNKDNDIKNSIKCFIFCNVL